MLVFTSAVDHLADPLNHFIHELWFLVNAGICIGEMVVLLPVVGLLDTAGQNRSTPTTMSPWLANMLSTSEYHSAYMTPYRPGTNTTGAYVPAATG